MKKGFTLIELMIVIAIIAVIAAIAIPNLMRSRQTANEAAAAASCVSIGSAQTNFAAADKDRNGLRDYATPQNNDSPSYTALYTTVTLSGVRLELINQAVATAATLAGVPIKGYLYLDMTTNGAGQPFERTSEWAVCAVPAQYGRTGENTFIYGSTGTIYSQDLGNGNGVVQWPADPQAAGWTSQ